MCIRDSLETAPYLIAIFAQSYGVAPDGRKLKHYYVTESVGIATGFLIAALHDAGLAMLTHTPSPMGFLNTILERPDNERPFLLLVGGYPAADAQAVSYTHLDVYKRQPTSCVMPMGLLLAISSMTST